ncbi:MAG: hypothetical protein EBZ48_09910 [Proteobacteria bacterium]|nr:hypothetical protein [Pseudomonadota bacterium]
MLSLDGAAALGINQSRYSEPQGTSTVEGALLSLARTPSESSSLSAAQRSALQDLVMGLSGLRQYNLLLACDGPREGRHGCLFVAGQGLFGANAQPKHVPDEFAPFQRALLDAHKHAAKGEVTPTLIDLQPVVTAGHNLFLKLSGATPEASLGN